MFYDELSDFWGGRKARGAGIVLGDLNARLLRQFPGEEEVAGPSTYGNPIASDAESNRSLLLGMCVANHLQIVSTGGNRPVTERIIYFCKTAKETDPVSPEKFSRLDHFVVEVKMGQQGDRLQV